MSKSFHEVRRSGGIIKKVIKPATAIGKGIKKVAAPVTNRLTRSGRAAIAQKKIDKHNTKVNQRDTIKRANAAGKSAFGFTQKQRAANAKKKLDKIAKRKRDLDTINRAKNLKRNVTAGTNYESTEEGKMKSFHDLLGELEEAKNAAQQAAIAIAKKEKGEKPKNEKVECPKCKGEGCDHCDGKGYHESIDRDALNKAMAAFKKKGGKVTKVPAAKAQGYHGKDDPGKDMHGMMDKPDTKRFKTKKGGKIRSMGSLRNQTEAKRTVTIDRPDRLTSLRVSKDKPPFDNAKPANKDPKDKFGNPIKNRARHLARKAAKGIVGEKKLMKGIEVDDDTLRMFKANPKLVPNSAVFRRLDPKTQSAVKKHLRIREELEEKKFSVGAPESVVLDKVQKMIANTKNAPEAYKLVANKMKVTDAMAKKLVNKVIDRSLNKGKK